MGPRLRKGCEIVREKEGSCDFFLNNEKLRKKVASIFGKGLASCSQTLEEHIWSYDGHCLPLNAVEPGQMGQGSRHPDQWSILQHRANESSVDTQTAIGVKYQRGSAQKPKTLTCSHRHPADVLAK